MAAVGHCERAARADRVCLISERRLRAEGDVRQVEAVPLEVWIGPEPTLPLLETVGSTISTLPLPLARALKYADVYRSC